MARNTIDSNSTGLAYALESDLRTLPDVPEWNPLEPNTYSDFGGQIKTVARNPINPSRQQRKGVVTDLDASGGFNTDLTFSNMTDLLQGFFFADARETPSTKPLNGTQNVLVSAENGVITGTSNMPFVVNDYVIVCGNQGRIGDVSMVTAVDGKNVTLSPPTTLTEVSAEHYIKKVGVNIVGTTSLVNGVASITGAEYDVLGVIAGEWVYLGGVGFARVASWADKSMTFDKVTDNFKDGMNVSGVYVGDLIKNESDPSLIKLRTYQLERQVGRDANGVMSEYLVGAAPNELTINITNADKVTCDLAFVALDNEQRDGKTGVKGGNRLTLPVEDCYNTSSDVTRIKMSIVDPDGANPAPLYAFSTELKLVINNNISANKAIGVLGGFDVTSGMFAVTATQTAYFADMPAVQAVRNNDDVTLDLFLQKSHNALIFDIPLLSLGDGRLTVAADKPITLALNITGAENKFGSTLTYHSFPYLP